RWQYLRRYGRWSLEDVSKSDYENMSGRAGRLAFMSDFGRSLLVTSSPFEADVWLRHYVGGEFEEIVPTLKEAPLENHVVNLLASGLAHTKEELRDLLLQSFTGFVYWTQKMSRDEFAVALDRAARLCADGGLIREEADGRVAVTDLGRACATKGLGVDTGIALAAWAHEARLAVFSELEVLTAVSLTPAGDEVYVTMSNEERYQADYRGQLLHRASAAGVSERPVFQRFADDTWAIEYPTAKSLKKALLLCDWIDEVRTKDIERRYHVWAGSLRRVGEEYGWLVEALGAIAKACGWPDGRCQELDALSARLVHGVRPDALALARLRVRGLGRAFIRRLVDANLGDVQTLRAAGAETVRKTLNHRGAFAALWARLREREAPPLVAGGYPEIPTTAALRAAEPEGTYEGLAPPGEEIASEPHAARHELRFAAGGRAVDIDGVRIAGEIVPILRLLKDLFLEDQKTERASEFYRRLKGREISRELGIDDTDGELVRRRIHTFRRRLATAYVAQHDRTIGTHSIVENSRRA
ncbi:MAG: hypothetical protein ACOY3Y_11620, partial [Acidobacteriota bacterium]